MPNRWHPLQQLFHWLIALAVFAQLGIGVWMVATPYKEPTLHLREVLFWAHTSLGITILILAVLRLVWRLTHAHPPLPPDLPGWQVKAAHASHILLYLLLFTMPIIGIVMVSAYGEPVPFWWTEIGPVIEQNKALGRTLVGVHIGGAVLFVLLLMVHIGAALQHEFIRKDNVLRSMTPMRLR